MLSSLNSGVSGLQQMQQEMDVIGNNIANVNTIGYKSSRSDFEDALSQSVGSSGAGNPMQVGTGVTTGSISTDFGQGAESSTGKDTDFAIKGDGYFVVRDTTTNNLYATRAGNFLVDNNGYLVTQSGMRVQGFSDAGLTTRGDVKIDNNGSATSMTGYSFKDDGTVTVTLDNAPSIVRGQILLQDFSSPEALVNAGSNLYSGLTNAGPLSQTTAPKTTGLGSLQSGYLEASNVDLANEFATMITTQRGFQANARTVTTSDEILQELVNLKR